MTKINKAFAQSRREFLLKSGRLVSTIGAAATLAPFGAVNALAQSGSDYKAIVCIFMFGGNDANNMIVPMGPNYAAYQKIRQSLALPEGSLLSTPTSKG
ncbi:MAG: Tat pathway signal protein, partial [Acidobacteria bacterium]|nr:Tat pathway signal protein [Acidobacteriota bacterium]